MLRLAASDGALTLIADDSATIFLHIDQNLVEEDPMMELPEPARDALLAISTWRTNIRYRILSITIVTVTTMQYLAISNYIIDDNAEILIVPFIKYVFIIYCSPYEYTFI